MLALIAMQQVRVRVGSPVTGYGSESRNRASRQRIPNKTWTDEDGVEHVVVSDMFPIWKSIYGFVKNINIPETKENDKLSNISM